MDDELRRQLEKLEHELVGIRKAVETPWYRTLLRGLLRGGGFVIGTVLAIAIFGWLLSLFDVIPGLSDITERLEEILETQTEL